MSIRLPLTAVLTSDNSTEVGAGSVLGGVPILFTIPQDTDNIVVKFQAQTAGAGVSATLQTTDDGGTTWFDVARTSIVSSANGVLAQWLSVPTHGFGQRTGAASIVAVGSTIAGTSNGTIGNTPPSILGNGQYSGMPILSQQGRIFLILQSGVTAATVLTTEVKVNNQAATA